MGGVINIAVRKDYRIGGRIQYSIDTIQHYDYLLAVKVFVDEKLDLLDEFA